MNRDEILYYVRLEPSDRRYWHWWLARRDRLDVFHQGRWYALVAWKELIRGQRPYPVEATLASRALERDAHRDEQLAAVPLSVLRGVEQQPVDVRRQLLAADEPGLVELADVGAA